MTSLELLLLAAADAGCLKKILSRPHWLYGEEDGAGLDNWDLGNMQKASQVVREAEANLRNRHLISNSNNATKKGDALLEAALELSDRLVCKWQVRMPKVEEVDED